MINKLFPSVCIVLLLIQFSNTCAQSTDLVRVEYLRIPENESGIQTSRYKFLLNAPIKVNEENYLIIGGEYNQFDVDFSQQLPFDKSELQKLHIIDLNLGYITKWNDNWRFIGILTPRLASNFTEGAMTDDFFFNATATLWKEKKDVEKPYRIVLGLTYNSTTGLPIPLPLISYYKRFHPKWSYTLGIPKMNFKYHPSSNHTLQLALLLDGYFINIQDDILLPDNTLGSRISLSALIGVIGYQYNITKMMSLYVLGGRSLIQEGILRNDRRDRTLLLNDEANFYLRTGFKISIF
ncbi:DUF6268 family outer membrane beta-barrel protein [Croceitalea sp. P059]|uniref:DUF6268 family outer membrane beta-barrel protein n=1 Tax=Croceitalea sp. P059 TaxID=3075601 RepID=UPI002883CA55|nr:DUF6268 family outer membrane beta-barrel protein [Croceitalea sp. P059]MDT0540350.1 DUF6268 family outer membrane beta-barrel protein [Croceitalea sp. P059]